MAASDSPAAPNDAAPRRDFAVEIVRKLTDAGHTALWAGGCVRDLLMEREPDDFDVATSATPEEVRMVFGRRRTLAVGESFGVIIVVGPRGAGNVEVATFRTEGPYVDGRRPSRVAFATPEADARRRDFTINGMFYEPLSGRVLDFVGGEQDLHAGVIRAIGDPRARMSEDKLRMLRAVRFAATLDFEMDPGTAEAVTEMAEQLTIVSWERIAAELQKMLKHRHRRRAVRLANQLGLLERIIPELAPLLAAADNPEWGQRLNRLDALASERFETAAAVLLGGLPVERLSRRGEPPAGGVLAACRRLKLSNVQCEAIEWLVANQHAIDGAETFPPARLKRLLAHPLFPQLLEIVRAAAVADNRDDPSLRFVDEYLSRTPREEIDPPQFVTGEDLLALGLRPGPKFKVLLEQLREAQLNGEVHDRAAALERLRSLAGNA